MAVATFDTLKFANTLKSAGVPDKQAEAQAVAFAEIIQVNMKDLATKEDLNRATAELKQEIKQDFATLSAKVDTTFEKLRGEQILIRWMFASIVALCLTMIGISLRLLIKV